SSWVDDVGDEADGFLKRAERAVSRAIALRVAAVTAHVDRSRLELEGSRRDCRALLRLRALLSDDLSADDLGVCHGPLFCVLHPYRQRSARSRNPPSERRAQVVWREMPLGDCRFFAFAAERCDRRSTFSGGALWLRRSQR